MRKLIIIFTIFYTVLSIPIHSELIVVIQRKDGIEPLPVSGILNAQIYAILMKYQWPMLTAHYATLPESEKQQMKTCGSPVEQCFIRHLLKKIDPALDVIYYPTALWELYAFTWLQNSKETLARDYTIAEAAELWKNWPKFIPGSLDSNLMAAMRAHWPMNRLRKLYTDLNNQRNVEAAYFSINHHLMHDLIGRFITKMRDQPANARVLEKWVESNLSALVSKPLHKLTMTTQPSFSLWPTKFSAWLTYKSPQSADALMPPELFLKFIQEENLAYKNDYALLFRGTQGFTPTSNGAKEPQRTVLDSGLGPHDTVISLSYGTSLLAGSVNDPGATAARYIASPGYPTTNSFGYVLPLSKKDYYEDVNGLGSLFFVSPLSTLVGLVEHGEFFHARSNFGLLGLKNFAIGGIEIGNTPSEATLRGLPRGFLVIPNEDYRVVGARITTYIAKHARIIAFKGNIPKKTEEKIIHSVHVGQIEQAIQELRKAGLLKEAEELGLRADGDN